MATNTDYGFARSRLCFARSRLPFPHRERVRGLQPPQTLASTLLTSNVGLAGLESAGPKGTAPPDPHAPEGDTDQRFAVQSAMCVLVWRGWIKISQKKHKFLHIKFKISQIKVKISQNKVEISQNYSQCWFPVHVFFLLFSSSFFFFSCHFGGSVHLYVRMLIRGENIRHHQRS